MYSHTCGDQNKNLNVAVIFLVAMQNNRNLYTDHKCVVSRYRYLKCNVDHGLTEKQEKKLQTFTSFLICMIGINWYICKKKNLVELSYGNFLHFADFFKLLFSFGKSSSLN